MKFHDFYIAMSDLRLFDLATVLERTDGRVNGGQNPVTKELYRWRRMGRVRNWRRELYSVSENHGGPKIHPLELAVRVQPPAYISLTTALEWHGALEPRDGLWTGPTTVRSTSPGGRLGASQAAQLIATLDPPGTVVVVGARYAMSFQNELGSFRYRQIHPRLFWGFSQELVGEVEVPIALPHKALVDLWHLTRGRWTPQVYEALQLNTTVIDRRSLAAVAQMHGLTPRVRVAYANFENYVGTR